MPMAIGKSTDLPKICLLKQGAGNCKLDYNLEELLDNCDKALVVASQSKHCLYSRFLKKDNQLHTTALRRRGHNFTFLII